MKKFLLLLAFMLMPAFCYAGPFQFCENIDDQWKPVKAGVEFPGPAISWLATADKQFGIPRVTLTIYRHDANSEKLVERKEIDVNPDWDTVGMRNMSLPEEGNYTLVLSTPDGKALCKGNVKITKFSGQPAGRQETLGARLETLFKKYAPKK